MFNSNYKTHLHFVDDTHVYNLTFIKYLLGCELFPQVDAFSADAAWNFSFVVKNIILCKQVTYFHFKSCLKHEKIFYFYMKCHFLTFCIKQVTLKL